MSINRRDFLKLSTGMLLATGPMGPVFAKNNVYHLLSCRSDTHGKHHLSAISPEGKLQFDVSLPGRGHGICVKSDNSQCVVFARRPNDFMWVVDMDNGKVLHQLTSPEGRHYFGHGAFEPQGRLLYVTENAYDEGRGVIGVYDAADNYKRLGELPSHGIGPHELKFLTDGKTLVIANGGIFTHPDSGRSKLNLADMNPNLAYIDSTDGRLLGLYRPPSEWHQLSIRHLDVAADDKVCIAMQFQGRLKQYPPLIALHQGQDYLQLLSAPAQIQKRMRNYCGSVTCDHSGQLFAVSSPRGNLLTLWSVNDGKLLNTIEYTDGCGLARNTKAGHFYASNGLGRIAQIGFPDSAQAGTGHDWAGWRWDNHMLAVAFS